MALPDSDDLATYISVVGLTDFSLLVDPKTDMSAKGVNQALCTLAMGSRMFARAIVAFIDNGPTVPVTFHEAVWGNSFGVTPGVVNAGTGLYTITWPTAVNDQLGVSHSVNLRAVMSAQVMPSAGGFWHCDAAVASANTVSVRTANAAGTLANASSVPVWVVVL